MGKKKPAKDSKKVPKAPDTRVANKRAADILCMQIRRIQKRKHGSRREITKQRIALGAALVKLKAKTEHVDWAKRRGKLGFDERTAQRLMAPYQSEISLCSIEVEDCQDGSVLGESADRGPQRHARSRNWRKRSLEKALANRKEK